MLYSYFIDVKSVPCYNWIGKGDCSPSHHLVSCAIRRRIATARFIIAVIRLILFVSWSFLLPLFFLVLLLNVFTSFLILLYNIRTYISSYFYKKNRESAKKRSLLLHQIHRFKSHTQDFVIPPHSSPFANIELTRSTV